MITFIQVMVRDKGLAWPVRRTKEKKIKHVCTHKLDRLSRRAVNIEIYSIRCN